MTAKTMNKLSAPCQSCPQRVASTASDIPAFDIALAESLAATCPDKRGMRPDFPANIFACHQSKPGDEFACAGWLATVGHAHPRIRLALATGQLPERVFVPGMDWPMLHADYQQVLAKLQATLDIPEQQHSQEKQMGLMASMKQHIT